MVLVSRLPLLVPVTLAAVLTLSAQQAPQTPAAALCRPSALLNPFLEPVSGVPVNVDQMLNGDMETDFCATYSGAIVQELDSTASHVIWQRLTPGA